MSPVLVSEVHLAAIAEFAAAHFVGLPKLTEQLPAMDNRIALMTLFRLENERSIQCVTGATSPPLRPPALRPSVVLPLELLKLLDCLEANSNAAPDYYDTAAYLATEGLRRRAICMLPGYAEAPWDHAAAMLTQAQGPSSAHH